MCGATAVRRDEDEVVTVFAVDQRVTAKVAGLASGGGQDDRREAPPHVTVLAAGLDVLASVLGNPVHRAVQRFVAHVLLQARGRDFGTSSAHIDHNPLQRVRDRYRRYWTRARPRGSRRWVDG